MPDTGEGEVGEAMVASGTDTTDDREVSAVGDTTDATSGEGGTGGNYTRRQRILKWIVLSTLSSQALVFPVWALYELYFPGRLTPGTPVPETAPALVALVLCLVMTVLGWAMTRQRLNGRREADPRLYWGLVGLLVLVCLLFRTPLHVIGLVANVLCLLSFMSTWSRTRYVIPLCLFLMGGHTLLYGPYGESWPFLIFLSALFLLFVLVAWFACLPVFWLWDATREAVEGERARARLAVNEERLRFAEDMRGLLGHELSALEVGARRAEGLVDTDPEAAKERIGRVHELARSTLHQVRSVVRGYRDLDLYTEVRAVRSVLEANHTVTTVSGLDGLNPPSETAALAAWVVREGGTNVLRHSGARRCRIDFSMAESADGVSRELVVEMVNDRAEGGEEGETGSAGGLSGLADRVERNSGSLTATRTSDGGFLLRAVLPLQEGASPSGAMVEGHSAVSATAHPARGLGGGPGDTASSGPGTAGERAPHGSEAVGETPEERDDHRIRIARLIIMVLFGFNGLVMCFWGVLDLVTALSLELPLWPSAVGTVVTMVNFVILNVLIWERLNGNRSPNPPLYWTSLVLLFTTGFLLQSPETGMLTVGTWWGIGLFLAPRRTSLLVSFALLLSPLLFLPGYGFETELNVGLYALVWLIAVLIALLFAGGTVSTIWLWDVSLEAVAGQRARARLAVTEERLRFARDMHDLLGHSLSALAVKAQLAGRLVDRAPDRAAVEMAEVRSLAREALGQVRSAVNGYREIDLEQEISSVTAVLESGGTSTTITGLDGLDVPPRTVALAAWVVREGGTNVLRHSDAEQCQITFISVRGEGASADTLVLEIHNDRAHGAEKDTNGGNGLTGLRERVAAQGGTVSGSPTGDGGFLLRAVLPL
ncbi:sensor histidine kinase [Nocardiopsis alba]|uniref:sensor histidine kinase n=1 Tax=Nocardiopsis alba TaxID=53437 RepID=UPI00366B8650